MRHPLVGIVLILAAASAAAAQPYDLQLARSMPVGTQYRVAATGTIERTGTRTFAGGQPEPVQPQKMVVTLAAGATIAEVADDGRATRIDFKIDRCTAAMDDGEARAIIPAGKVLIARVQGDALTFEIQGEGIVRDVRQQALASVIRMPTGQAGFDETFGPRKPVQKGDRWAINEAAYRKQLMRSSVDPQSGRVEGQVQLVDAVDDAAGTLFTVRGDVSSTGLKPTAAADELGPQRSDVSMTVSFTIVAPADARRPILRESGTMDMKMRMTGDSPEGKPVTVDAVIRQTIHLTRTPVAPGRLCA